MRTGTLGFAGALFATCTSVAAAGTITGKVPVSGASEADRTLIYVENVPTGSFDATAKAPKLSQKGAQFTPALLPVVRGSQVDMSNDDWVAHSVFSKSGPKPFDLGIYAQDAKKLVTFDSQGVVEVFCSIHPRMNAVILVLQNPFFTKPRKDGSYTLEGVPAGSYDVKMFRRGQPPKSQKVKVPATGSVDVEF